MPCGFILNGFIVQGSGRQARTMMATATQCLIILSGLWLVAVGILMLASPQAAIRYLGKAASTNFINFLELTLRGVWGLALVFSADFSRFPKFFRIFGLFVVVSTAILFFVPRRWHAQYALWWSNKLTEPQVRILSPFSLAFGAFLIYAVL